MPGSLLLTGASGTLGQGLVPLLLERTDLELFLLVHERPLAVRPTAASRVHLITGDLRQPNLGLPPEMQSRLAARLTHILHAAATTQFNLPLAKAAAVNVAGTEALISLAQRCHHLERFGFLSTVYVSGKRTGNILESERTHESGFVNSYEESKYHAEAVVEHARASVPTAIYRLSTIIGDSRSGVVRHFTAPHQALRMMYLGLAAMVPGNPDYVVDLIPSDFAVGAVAELFLDHFSPGQVFHVVAGAEKSYRLSELIEASFAALAAHDPAWARRAYPRPLIAPPAAFDLFLASAEQAQNPLVLSVLQALRHFAHQLNYPKEFDQTNLRRCLPDFPTRLPDIRQYFDKVVQYCLTTHWGTHART